MNIKEEYKSFIDGTHEDFLENLIEKREELDKKIHIINVLKCVAVFSELLEKDLEKKATNCIFFCVFDPDYIDYRIGCSFKNIDKEVRMPPYIDEKLNELSSDYFNDIFPKTNKRELIDIKIDNSLPNEILKLLLNDELLAILNHEKLDSILTEKEVEKFSKIKL